MVGVHRTFPDGILARYKLRLPERSGRGELEKLQGISGLWAQKPAKRPRVFDRVAVAVVIEVGPDPLCAARSYSFRP